MPSVRFARDKRGYEYVYLVHAPTRKGKPGKSRVLYWYRTPPGVRIGRKPFDEEVRRTLEAQNPGLTFDWEVIVATPMPPPDMTEYWRERRRLEKAAKLERLAEEALQAAASSLVDPSRQEEEGITSETSGEYAEAFAANSSGGNRSDDAGDEAAPSDDAEEDAADNSEPAGAAVGGQGAGEPRRKRRRRGGRRRRGAPQGQTTEGQPVSNGPADDPSGGIELAPQSDGLAADSASNRHGAPDSQISSSIEPLTSSSEE